ncbi:MAG: outer membrane beta-barrel protein [Pseudomonadales bacterium]|jgi:outer membrane protein|nr:outer membrane beta-barrel protein [Pseudomonadales bacterium]MBP9032459.1 outer membrane beta-barrel protein [Pseudomonadales bacterium]
MTKVSKLGLLAAAMLVSGAASAYEAGDWIVRGGAVMVDPNDDSSRLNVDGIGALDGTGVEVDDDTQLLLNITYMASEHVGVELLAATPFEHTVDTAGLGGLGLTDVELGEIKHLPPTLSALWYPMPGNSKFQPFFGIGVNYTVFFDEDTSGEAQDALGADNLSLDDSWGLAGRIGMDYMINDCWSLHAGAYYIDISTEAEVDTALGTAKVDVDVDPWVYTLGLGYRF